MNEIFRQELVREGDDDESARWSIGSDDVPVGGVPWRVTRRRLRGGLQEGVETISVENGALRFTVIPTRGMNIWDAHLGNLRIGWESPVKRLVHPAFIDPMSAAGMGWHGGFGEWMTRCGLESCGTAGYDGKLFLTQHGRISNLPANRVEVLVERDPVPRIVIRGEIDECIFYGPQLRLVAEISTVIGSTAIGLDDTIVNLGDAPQEFQSLYHTNFGAPLLGKGARFVAPVETLTPINARSAENGMAGWTDFAGPQPPGYQSQVFLLTLHADAARESEVMLVGADGDAAVSMRFDTAALPCLALWKNESSPGRGYVAGIEPGTSYPTGRAIEREHGRVPVLPPGGSHRARLTISILDGPERIAAERRIGALQAAPPQLQPTPLLAD